MSPLSRLSTRTLLRSLFLSSLFTSPALYNAGLKCFSWIANSQSAILNPDKNILLRAVIRPLIYNQFCAGTNKAEVEKTIADMKRMGYAGVIMCYGKEIVLDHSAPKAAPTSVQDGTHEAADPQIDLWRDGTLITLGMVGAGDYIGVKYTGAGSSITKALSEGRDPPKQFLTAMDSVCQQAAAQGSRLWIDAEQQVLQPTINKWTTDLMSRHNRNGEALVSNTIQAYLKSSRDDIAQHLRAAKEGNYALGIKLVRGAYIGSDVRERIHDTKADTDAFYNGIAHDLLTKTWPGFDKSSFPAVNLFLAGHNTESIRKASGIIRDIVLAGGECPAVRFGQLQGMADDISCELLQLGEQASTCEGVSDEKEKMLLKASAPQVYKCSTWGTVQECMQYLVRRAIENSGATERMTSGAVEMRAELRRRIMPF